MQRFFLAPVLCGVVMAVHAQLPAGTHEADDHSRQDASSARIKAAETALEKGEFAEAITLLKQLAAEQPKDAHVLYDLGYAQESTGDESSAAASYSSAIAADSMLPEPQVALGLLDARNNRAAKAHAELAGAVHLANIAPDLHARALRALAALDETTDPEAAREELLEAVRLTGEAPPDMKMSADLAATAGDPADAEQALRRALAADATNPETAAALGSALQHQGKYADAEAVLQAALAAHPNDPRLVSQTAAVYGAEGKPQQGIALLQQARSADPQFAANAAVTRMLARLDTMDDKNDDAAHLYEGLLAQKSDDPALLDEYGGVLVKLARFPEAEAVLRKAVGMRAGFSSQSDWGEAAGHLAFAASRNHDPSVVLQALSARATVLPNSAASLFLEATAHDSLHQTKDAVKAYKAFLAAAKGKFPDQEFQARHRLVALEHEH